jgi:hypothetical protein
MKITSDMCKAAIVAKAAENPDYIRSLFVLQPGEQFDISSCTKVKNWERMSKEMNDWGFTERGFDCTPYDDQLRAYTLDDGNKILSVEIVGE